MKNKKLALLLITMLFISFILTGCTKLDNLKVKFGIKNTDFEYIAQNKVQKIIIQSTRDPGFRFIVTDKRSMTELYDILSSAKPASEKSNLDPDYIFEFHESSDKVYKFNYVAGIQKKGIGNFFDETNSYVVSKRIDNDIIKNLSTLRKPRAFETLYYDVVLSFLENFEKSLPKDKKIGVNISDDVEVSKYILSNDLEDFKVNLKSKMNNVELVSKDKENFDILLNVKTYGYKSTIYKSIITLHDKSDNSDVNYYVLCEYKEKNWDIKISKDKPENY